MASDPWTEATKSMLRDEMKRAGVTYDDLAKRLEEIGETISPAGLRVKVSRGGFSAVFMVQCLTVLGVRDLSLAQVERAPQAGAQGAQG